MLTTASELLKEDEEVLSVELINTGAVFGCHLYEVNDPTSIAWVTARALRDLAVAVLCSSACPDGARELLVDLAGESVPHRRQQLIAHTAAARAHRARPAGPVPDHRRSPSRGS